MREKRRPKLDQDEKDLLESYERGEWVSIRDLESEKLKAEEAAVRFVKRTDK